MSNGAPESDAFFDDTIAQIERYLDGAMSPEEKEAFAARLASDEALRNQVDAVNAANAVIARSLAQQFAPPSGSEAMRRVREAAQAMDSPVVAKIERAATSATATRPGRWRGRGMWMGLAATLLLATGATLMMWRVQSQHAVERGMQLAAYYDEQVQLGLTPQWVCKDEPTFRAYTKMRLGAEMTFGQLPSGVALVGWTYVRGPMRSDTNAVLMATRDETPVLVVAERRDHALSVEPPTSGHVRVFRRDLADVTLYEITPLDAPVLLDVLTQTQ